MNGLEDLEPLAEAIAAETAVVAPPIRERARFLRFLLTGGLAAAINVAARWLFHFAMAYELAICLAYLVGMTTAFVLARIYVFDHGSGRARTQYARFALVNFIAFVQVWIVSVTLARLVFPAMGLIWQAETIAHVVGVISPVATSYLGHKHFSFRS